MYFFYSRARHKFNIHLVHSFESPPLLLTWTLGQLKIFLRCSPWCEFQLLPTVPAWGPLNFHHFCTLMTLKLLIYLLPSFLITKSWECQVRSKKRGNDKETQYFHFTRQLLQLLFGYFLPLIPTTIVWTRNFILRNIYGNSHSELTFEWRPSVSVFNYITNLIVFIKMSMLSGGPRCNDIEMLKQRRPAMINKTTQTTFLPTSSNNNHTPDSNVLPNNNHNQDDKVLSNAIGNGPVDGVQL